MSGPGEQKRVTSRGEQTREHLVDVAERLYGERGIDGVSLREIRLAAGQRNTAALQYHFGDRQGLLTAIAARHMPRLDARQAELYELAVAEGRDDVRSLVEVLLRPMAEYTELGPSERSWVKMAANLGGQPTLSQEDFERSATPAARAAGLSLYTLLSADLGGPLTIERLFSVGQSAVHVCADRARLGDPGSRRTPTPSTVFIDNLIDMACGALQAPVSASVRDALS